MKKTIILDPALNNHRTKYFMGLSWNLKKDLSGGRGCPLTYHYEFFILHSHILIVLFQ